MGGLVASHPDKFVDEFIEDAQIVRKSELNKNTIRHASVSTEEAGRRPGTSTSISEEWVRAKVSTARPRFAGMSKNVTSGLPPKGP